MFNYGKFETVNNMQTVWLHSAKHSELMQRSGSALFIANYNT